MADLTSWIGGTIGYVENPLDQTMVESDFAALSYAEIGEVKTIGALGDTSAAINVSLLKEGRVLRLNGEKDGGEISVAVAYNSDSASYAALRALANTNTTCAFEVTDPDDEIVYFQALVANWQETERNNTTEKGATFVLRVNAAYVYA